MRLIVLLVIIITIISCEHTNIPNGNNDKYCKPPVKVPYGLNEIYRFPKYNHAQLDVSYNNAKLTFKSGNIIKILDIQTNIEQEIDLSKKLPSNIVLFSVNNPQWCPYNNNRILVYTVTGTDTIGDGKNFVYGQNLYFLSLDGSEFQRITPSIFGPTGANANLWLKKWLPQSNSDADMVLLSYVYKGIGYSKIYVPQRDEMIENNYGSLLAINKDGNRFFSMSFLPSENKTIYLLDGLPLNFSETFERSDDFNASFSSDSKLLAFSVIPSSDYDKPDSLKRFEEIWVIDVDKYLDEKPDTVPVKIINLREKFCMYALNGIWAEFISENTLAVSMHKDGDEASYLWEITIDGKIVRQLTFEP